MVELVEAHVMMCLTGYFNIHVRTAETVEHIRSVDSDGEQGIERVESW